MQFQPKPGKYNLDFTFTKLTSGEVYRLWGNNGSFFNGAAVTKAVVGAARRRLLLGQRRGSAEHRAQDQQQHEHLLQGDLLSTEQTLTARTYRRLHIALAPREAPPSCYKGCGVRGV